jgi:hypothetical protein
MRCLEIEGLVILLAAGDLSAGKALSAGDIERLAIAVGRVGAALEVVA